MKRKKNDITWNKENHPDWYYDIPVMEILIIGSFPPHPKKRDFDFYYPNKQNHFWKILSRINSGADPQFYSGTEAVEERKLIMRKLKAGVQNMGKIILRKGESARDTDIKMQEYHDILAIIDEHPELKTIIIAGYSAISSSFRTFLDYLISKNVDFDEVKKISPGQTFTINYKGRSLSCIIVNSTSTAARIELKTLVEQFLAAIKIAK